MDHVITSLQEQERFESGCLGKEKFPSESAALAALKIYEHIRHTARACAYPCRFCNQWHLSGGSH